MNHKDNMNENTDSYQLIEEVKEYVYSVYPFLLQGKPIYHKYSVDLESCIECYLLDHGLVFNVKKVKSIAFDILNSRNRMMCIIHSSSLLYDLEGNEVKEPSSFDRYFAQVRLKEIAIEDRDSHINNKIRILNKKISEIMDWKKEFLKLNAKINNRIELLTTMEEKNKQSEEQLRAKRKELNFEIGLLKKERYTFEQNKQSKPTNIGKYMKDMIIKEYIEQQRLACNDKGDTE